jgi:hypothetical protein
MAHGIQVQGAQIRYDSNFPAMHIFMKFQTIFLSVDYQFEAAGSAGFKKVKLALTFSMLIILTLLRGII